MQKPTVQSKDSDKDNIQKSKPKQQGQKNSQLKDFVFLFHDVFLVMLVPPGEKREEDFNIEKFY